jgi:cell volume regulation protein A
MALGALVGLLSGWLAARAFNRLRLEFDGLYPVLMIAVVALVYAATARIGGSGLLAVYLAGLVIGNSQIVHRQSLMRFLDAVAWLMQIGMFLVLGLLVFPSDLPPVALRALVITAVLILVARPVATFVSLVLSGFGVREKLLVSWLGLRGAVPIVLATFPVAEDVREANTLFDVVFFVVVVSVLVQGTTLGPVARALGVSGPVAEAVTDPAALERVGDALQEVLVSPGSEAAGHPIVDLHLPAGVLVVLVSRDGSRVVPQGSTVLRSGDRVLLLADDEVLAQVRRLFSDE